MPKQKIAAAVAAIAMSSALACASSTNTDRRWSVQFLGVVEDGVGARVPGATVSIQGVNVNGSTAVSRGKCVGDVVTPLTGQTDADGRYALTLEGGGPPIFACMFIEARATFRGASLSGSVEKDSVLIGPTGVGSITIDVIVRP